MTENGNSGNDGSGQEGDILLQLLRRLSLDEDFDAPSLHQLCVELRDAAMQRQDEKSQVSARLAGKIAHLIDDNFLQKDKDARPHRNGGPKNKSSGC